MKRGLGIVILVVLLSSVVFAGSFFEGSVWDEVLSGQAVKGESEEVGPEDTFVKGLTGWFFQIFATKGPAKVKDVGCPGKDSPVKEARLVLKEQVTLCKFTVYLDKILKAKGKDPVRAHVRVDRKAIPLKMNAPRMVKVGKESQTQTLYFLLVEVNEKEKSVLIKVAKSLDAFQKKSPACQETVELAKFDSNTKRCTSTNIPCEVTKCGKTIRLVGVSGKEASNIGAQVAVENTVEFVTIGSQKSVRGLYVYTQDVTQFVPEARQTTETAQLTVSTQRILPKECHVVKALKEGAEALEICGKKLKVTKLYSNYLGRGVDAAQIASETDQRSQIIESWVRLPVGELSVSARKIDHSTKYVTLVVSGKLPEQVPVEETPREEPTTQPSCSQQTIVFKLGRGGSQTYCTKSVAILQVAGSPASRAEVRVGGERKFIGVGDRALVGGIWAKIVSINKTTSGTIVTVAFSSSPSSGTVGIGGSCIANAQCATGLVCSSAGKCAQPIAPVAQPTDKCQGVTCPRGATCDPNTGECVGESAPQAAPQQESKPDLAIKYVSVYGYGGATIIYSGEILKKPEPAQQYYVDVRYTNLGSVRSSTDAVAKAKISCRSAIKETSGYLVHSAVDPGKEAQTLVYDLGCDNAGVYDLEVELVPLNQADDALKENNFFKIPLEFVLQAAQPAPTSKTCSASNWWCPNGTVKLRQNTDCSEESTVCTYGCALGTCQGDPTTLTCAAGWKCANTTSLTCGGGIWDRPSIACGYNCVNDRCKTGWGSI